MVPWGANGKPFLVLKQAERETVMPEELAKVLKSLELPKDVEKSFDEYIEKQKLSDKVAKAAKGALRILTAFKDEMPETVMKALADASGLPLPEKKIQMTEKELEAELEKRMKKKEKAEGCPVKKDGTLDLDKVPEESRGMVEMLWKQNKANEDKLADVQKSLDEAKDAKLQKEYVEKASAYKHLPIKAEDFGKVLKALHTASPDEAKELDKVLKATDDAIAKGDLFKEKGGNGDGKEGGEGAWDKIMKMAKGLVEKSETKLTLSQAMDKVLKTEEGQKLYDEYDSANTKAYED
jgi:hypothetical protein